MADFHEV